MARYKELIEIKGKLAAEMKRMSDLITGENRDFTAEESERWQKVNAQYNTNEARLAVEQRAAEAGAGNGGWSTPPRTTIGNDGSSSDGNHEQTAGASSRRLVSRREGCTDSPVSALKTAQQLRVNTRSDELTLNLMSTSENRRFRNRFGSTPLGERPGISISARRR